MSILSNVSSWASEQSNSAVSCSVINVASSVAIPAWSTVTPHRPFVFAEDVARRVTDLIRRRVGFEYVDDVRHQVLVAPRRFSKDVILRHKKEGELWRELADIQSSVDSGE